MALVHDYQNEYEVLQLVEGQHEFWLDCAITRGGPGSSIFPPPGVPHTFWVVGDGPGGTSRS
ncbi:AraC family ligand binding domain-containing protein [Mesorhizobium sp. Cs1299R1N1]|uniref:AraC family ligand binding domain-containing protein n=1 Tax=Mesorhizobium sp. Cs1299R1N1 TaxID=3015172 RepID=UPI003FA5FF76